MYAIVEIAGQQFKVEKGKKLYVHRLNAEEGMQVEFSKIMLAEDNGKVSVGKPYLEGAKITAKVLKHVKGDKILVFKKKRRNGYRKLNGHRQLFSQIEVEQITI
ncbi:MAG: 50S ribosomal protein L21 [Bacteroidales bacterium]|nr:50S ribosomal protein L21 [Bacteroidales bacterium]